MANNLIQTIKEIELIVYLSKLVILDMSGNALCQDPNYRIFTLFNIKKLKVLDSVAVEPQEIQMAKEYLSLLDSF